MRRSWQLAAVIAMLAGMATWQSGIATATSPSQDGDSAAVEMQDNVFRPRTLNVAVGTEVTWENAGENSHTTTSSSDEWDSDELAPGDSFSQTFEEPGVYTYFCRIHRDRGMVGTIVVGDEEDDEDSADQESAPAPADAAAPADASEGDSGDEYTAEEHAAMMREMMSQMMGQMMPPGMMAAPAEDDDANGSDGDDYADTDDRDDDDRDADDDRDYDDGDDRDRDGRGHRDYDDHGFYVVRPGDTLSGIASWFGVPVMSLAYANGIYNPNYIRYGEVLVIPGHGDYKWSGGYGYGSYYNRYGYGTSGNYSSYWPYYRIPYGWGYSSYYWPNWNYGWNSYGSSWYKSYPTYNYKYPTTYYGKSYGSGWTYPWYGKKAYPYGGCC